MAELLLNDEERAALRQRLFEINEHMSNSTIGQAIERVAVESGRLFDAHGPSAHLLWVIDKIRVLERTLVARMQAEAQKAGADE